MSLERISKQYKSSFPSGTKFGFYGKTYSEYVPLDKKKKSSRNVGVMRLPELLKQLEILPELIEVNKLNFITVMSLRALKIFQNSFKYKRFYSAKDSTRWEISEFTKRKRASAKPSRWPGNGELNEFGTMLNSMRLAKTERGMKIFTNPSCYNTPNCRSKHCYARIHNDPTISDTYGNGFGGRITPKKVIRRQFMGHSTYIEDFSDKIIGRYMFDSVFK